MQGPLAAVVYDTTRTEASWWEASATPTPTPDVSPLEAEEATDVAIIGGGLCGLSCARALAERGIGATVLEAGEIGWGASGRAGGLVCFGGWKLSRGRMIRRHGLAETERAERSLADWIPELRIFAEAHLTQDVQGDGELILAHGPRAARELAAETVPAGFSAEPVPPSGLADIARYGGVWMRPGFGVHPLKLTRAFAAAAVASGARLHPRSEVVLWERAGNGHRLLTAHGSLRAGRVVLAANAFTPERLHPAFKARLLPVISNIAVTRPLTEAERSAHPWLGDTPCSDSRALLVYFRLLPDGRLLFGMRGDLRGTEAGARRMQVHLRARLDRALPGLAGADFSHMWRGPVAMTRQLTPAIGQLTDAPTVFHAFGWHGSGIAMGTLAGRLVAAQIAGAPVDAVPAPWRGLPPPIPLPGLRPLYLGASMAAMALQDRLG
ncbi:MAG: NAD(P)/FAD-dependent oxidoreductase [Pikeienuella sp.]